MIKTCLILGMVVAIQGERPRDIEQYGGVYSSMDFCLLTAADWRRNEKNAKHVKHVWTVCAPEGTTGFKRCEKLNEK